MTRHDDPKLGSRDQTVRLERRGDVAVLRIDHPPVNALSPQVVQDMTAAFDAFERDTDSRLLVVACAGRTFVAGADIRSFDAQDFDAGPYNSLLARIEACSRPVVAALHGTVLGGGLELALACHGRVAAPSTSLGLPEVKLGLLPGSLGTQRLPRLVGVAAAIDMISSGRSLDAQSAVSIGLVDRIASGDIEATAIALARELVTGGLDARRLSTRLVSLDAAAQTALERAATAAKGSPYPTAAAIVQAVRMSAQPFEQGECAEAQLFAQLLQSPESKALRHQFFAQKEATKIPGLDALVGERAIRQVGVLGGGTMGRGIAMTFLNAGMPVVMVEANPEALQLAMDGIRGLYEASARKGKLTQVDVERRLVLLRGSTDDSALSDSDLVIEAVFENMALKQQVAARLGKVCKAGAVIATNTSTLDVDEIAAASGRAAEVIGMHFFSPAHVMRLLEVVRGALTAPDVVATVMKIARRIGKVAVVSGVCYGFIGNRMLEPYLREAEFLLLEGASPRYIDGIAEQFGMAMGPCRMLDMAGVDVAARVVIERERSCGLRSDASYRVVVRELFERGRLGQKCAAGFYRYDGREAVPDPEFDDIAAGLAARHGIERRVAIPEQEVLERLLYPLVNEAALILQEGIAYRGGDIDVVWVHGYGFPDYRGGPAFMADAIGLTRIADQLATFAAQRGNAHGYWTIAPLLTELARTNQRLSNWRARA